MQLLLRIWQNWGIFLSDRWQAQHHTKMRTCATVSSLWHLHSLHRHLPQLTNTLRYSWLFKLRYLQMRRKFTVFSNRWGFFKSELDFAEIWVLYLLHKHSQSAQVRYNLQRVTSIHSPFCLFSPQYWLSQPLLPSRVLSWQPQQIVSVVSELLLVPAV